MHVIITAVVSLEQSSNKGRELIWFPIKMQDLALLLGATERIVPPEIVKLLFWPP
jgi:hypothetical protein